MPTTKRKFSRPIRACILSLVILAFAPLSASGQWDKLPPVESRQHEIDLLAAGDLSMFVNANGTPITRQGWSAADGVLHHTKSGGNLFFKDPVADFVLQFEFKIAPGGNSGIKYRVAKYGNSWLGCEYQIQDDKDRLFHRHATGALYAVYEPAKTKSQNPAGQWNRGKIIVNGNRVQHWLNGILVVDAIAGSEDWNQRVARSKFRPHEGFGQNRSGRIMIQDHGTEAWYRNMKLTKLPATAQIPPSADFAIAMDAGPVLLNGCGGYPLPTCCTGGCNRYCCRLARRTRGPLRRSIFRFRGR